jgi:hypothetical protein
MDEISVVLPLPEKPTMAIIPPGVDKDHLMAIAFGWLR